LEDRTFLIFWIKQPSCTVRPRRIKSPHPRKKKNI